MEANKKKILPRAILAVLVTAGAGGWVVYDSYLKPTPKPATATALPGPINAPGLPGADAETESDMLAELDPQVGDALDGEDVTTDLNPGPAALAQPEGEGQANPDAADLANPDAADLADTAASQAEPAREKAQPAEQGAADAREAAGPAAAPRPVKVGEPAPMAPAPVASPVDPRVQNPATVAAVIQAPAHAVPEPPPAPLPADVEMRSADKPLQLTPEERAFATSEERWLRQVRLLTLQLEARELAEKLNGKTRVPVTHEIARQSIADSAGTPAPAAARLPAKPPAPVPSFRLLSIWGSAGDLRAEFQTATATRIVRTGQHVHDGWVLQSVHDSSVVLTRDKHTRVLSVGM